MPLWSYEDGLNPKEKRAALVEGSPFLIKSDFNIPTYRALC